MTGFPEASILPVTHRGNGSNEVTRGGDAEPQGTAKAVVADQSDTSERRTYTSISRLIHR